MTCPSRAVAVAASAIAAPETTDWGVEGSILIATGVLSVPVAPVGPESPPPPHPAASENATMRTSERGTYMARGSRRGEEFSAIPSTGVESDYRMLLRVAGCKRRRSDCRTAPGAERRQVPDSAGCRTPRGAERRQVPDVRVRFGRSPLRRLAPGDVWHARRLALGVVWHLAPSGTGRRQAPSAASQRVAARARALQ